MINLILSLPRRVARKLLSPFRSSKTQPSAAAPPPRPPTQEPPAWMRQDDHDDGHDHGHSHGHSHSHDHEDHSAPEPPPPETPEHNHQPSHASVESPSIDVMPIETPNPNAYKFATNLQIAEKSFSANNSNAAQNHPITKILFAIPGVAAVFGVNDFVTITKEDSADWNELIPAVTEALQQNLSA